MPAAIYYHYLASCKHGISRTAAAAVWLKKLGIGDTFEDTQQLTSAIPVALWKLRKLFK